MELLRCRCLIVFVLVAEIVWLQHSSVCAAAQRDIKFRIECRPDNDLSLAAPAPSLLSRKTDPAEKINDAASDQDSEQSAPQSQIKLAPDSKLSSDDKVGESPQSVDDSLPKIPKLKLPTKDAIMERIKSTGLQSNKKPDLLKSKNIQANPIASTNKATDCENETVKQPMPNDNVVAKPKLPKLSSILKSKQSEVSDDDTPKPKETLLSKIANNLSKLKKSKEPEIVEQAIPITESAPVSSNSKPSLVKLKSKLLKSPKIVDSPKEQLAQESAPAPKYSKLEKLLQLKKPAAPENFESSRDDYIISPKSTALKKAPPLKSSLLKSPNIVDSEPESPLKPLNLDKLSSALAKLRSTASNILEDDGNAGKLDPPKLSRLTKPFDFQSFRPNKLNLDNDVLQSERYSPKVPKLRSSLPDPSVRRPLLRKPYADQYLAAEQVDNSQTAMSLCECIKKAFPKSVRDGSFVLSDDGDLLPSADSMHPVYAAAPTKVLRDAGLPDVDSSAEKYSKIKNGVQKMIHFVDILGQVDQYISDRTKIIVSKLSKLYDQY